MKRQLDFQEKQECSALLATYKGEVAGYVFLYYQCRWGALGNCGLPAVVDLVVFEEYRRRGIATALFLWDLTDRTPNRYHMTFPANYNLTKPKEENIRCVQCNENLYDLGVAEVITPGEKA